MPNATAISIAKAIVDDLRGAAYYRDRRVLAEFLQSSFGSSPERASTAADAILDDLRGAAYYRNADVLAGYLESQFGRQP
jgi:hypothetical protein